MSLKAFIITAVLCIFFILCSINTAEESSHLPEAPDGSSYIVDKTGIISRELREDINKRCRLLKNETGVSLYFVSVESLSGYNSLYYAQNVLESWGVKPREILIVVSPNDRKAAIASNFIDYTDENSEMIQRSGMYFIQQGADSMVKYIFNTAVGKLYENTGLVNKYMFDDIKPLREYKALPYAAGTCLSISMVLLAFFFRFEHVGMFLGRKKFKADKSDINLILCSYLFKDTIISLSSVGFVGLYGLYLYIIGRLQIFYFFTPFFLLIIYPLLKDTVFVLIDLLKGDRVYIEGTVEKVFRMYFRYCFIIKDSEGHRTLISSNRKLVKTHNYISAWCTKRIKYTTELQVVYERLILN